MLGMFIDGVGFGLVGLLGFPGLPPLGGRLWANTLVAVATETSSKINRGECMAGSPFSETVIVALNDSQVAAGDAQITTN